MRNSLEEIEYIEQYLVGALTIEEKQIFEQKIQSDADFAQKVAFQKRLMQQVSVQAQKKELDQVHHEFLKKEGFFNRWKGNRGKSSGLLNLLMVFGGLGIILLSGYWFLRDGDDTSNTSNTHSEQGNTLNKAGDNLKSHYFLIDNTKDTVIETPAGMELVISANSFVYENNQLINGVVEVEIKEALDAKSIITSGLSTTSNGQLLETGGMFYLSAQKDGQSLKMIKTIYMEVPTEEKKADMQLFDGEVLADGSINWINPKPLEKHLTTLDINSLDFYPPNYLDSLRNWGYDVHNKKFTDSLYYSLAAIFDKTKPEVNREVEIIAISDENPIINDKRDFDRTPTSYHHLSDTMISTTICGINPSKIKAIWNNKFQNTLISTKEFEKRLKYIHSLKKSEILDLYVNHLDLNLSTIDSMVAKMKFGQDISNVFYSWAALGEGKVALNSKSHELLKEYYLKKQHAYTEAVSKTERAFWNKQQELNKVFHAQQNNHAIVNEARKQQMLWEEFNVNLDDVCKKLGIEKNGTIPEDVYRLTITSPGWKNIDLYVMEATMSRETTTIVGENGKSATINYDAVSFSYLETDKFDQIYMYLLPDKLSSFMRLSANKQIFEGKLNQIMSYQGFCVGMKDDHYYFFHLDTLEAKSYINIELIPIDLNDLNQKINKISAFKQRKDIQEEFAYLQIVNQEGMRQKQSVKRRELKDKLSNFLFYQCDNRSLKQDHMLR